MIRSLAVLVVLAGLLAPIPATAAESPGGALDRVDRSGGGLVVHG